MASSGSGRRGKRLPNSPISGSTPCSTGGRSRPGSRSATGVRFSSTRTWGWSARRSTRRLSPRSAGISRSGTAGTRRPAPASGRTPSRRSGLPRPGRSRSVTTATSPTPVSWPRRLGGERRPGPRAGRSTSSTRRRTPSTARPRDTDILTSMLAGYPDLTIEQAAAKVLPKVKGAFSLVFMDETTLYGARDPQGIRPLVLGRLERGWVIASETAALDIVGASFIREVEPGEIVAIDEEGLRSTKFAEPDPKGCLFEFVYLARPDTQISGQRIHSTRVEIGRRLAREHPAEADLVIATPESGVPGAIGYAEESGIPYGVGPGQERVRRPYLHPAEPDHPPARHPAQAEPAARGDRGQAPGRGRRHDRPRQHPARGDQDAARGRCEGDPRPDHRAAGEVAVLLRHRLRQPRRADRERAEHRGDLPLARRRLARLHQPGRPGRGHHGAEGASSAAPASTGSTRSRCRTRSTSASTCSSCRWPPTSTAWPRSPVAPAPRTPCPGRSQEPC